MQASSLAELFGLPGIPIFENRAATQQAASQNDFEMGGSDYSGGDDAWDGGDDFSGGLGDHSWSSDLQASDLIEAPRKVAQIGINYARASKQASFRNVLYHGKSLSSKISTR